ncbi:Crp/Fnr family transcriptional regulator [Mediterraneibacter agrestimuris]|uniref:Crp/Fnr family transcriptional regulator n=1 Tax=Mediterraneibacter agrestimuris TaxID=2941333 RepID=UPI00203FFCA2|nr:Crp/Fnr family transcriptional regulator [Mediterraneibacter agrestimuris]
MDVFNELPEKTRNYMNLLFQNCTEEVKYYMTLNEVHADTALIKAGERCSNIYIILSGKVTGIDWPINERAYSFKDFGPGDFFGEIECFADLVNYRISVVTVTKCRVLVIPAPYYMEWIRSDAEALYSRTKVNMRRLITQTTDARRYLFLEAKERLVLYLVRKYEQRRQGMKPVDLNLNQNRVHLSEEIGFSVKTLNRNIKILEELGFIQMNKGKITITADGYFKMKEYIDQHIYGEI